MSIRRAPLWYDIFVAPEKPFTAHLGPRDREVAVLAMYARVGEVQLRRIAPHQHARRLSLEKSLI
jgi:hypothetical protein